MGDGISDDFMAISAAINAAGAGAEILFTPGKTYLSCQPLQPEINQTLDFQGATLKKCDEVVSAVVAYTGAGNWELQDASQFLEGMWISVSSNGGYDVSTGALRIQSITGNLVKTQSSVEEPLANATMTSDGPLVHISTSGVTVKNFVFDGNYANNNTIIKWDTSVLVIANGENPKITDGEVRNIPGDFIRFANNADGGLVSNITASDGSGVFANISGTGLTGSGEISIINNTISRLNQEFERQGQASGAIAWGGGVGSVVIEGNTFSDLPVSAINMTDDPNAETVIIQNNIAMNTEGFVVLWKNVLHSDPSNSQTVEIRNNTLTNTKRNRIRVGAGDQAIREVIIRDNLGENTYWDVQGVIDFEFTNNEMKVTDLELAGLPEFDFFFTPGILQLRSIGNAIVDQNSFEGAWRHISFENFAQGDNFDFQGRYSFTNNNFKDFRYSGLQGRANGNGVGGSNERVDWSSNNNDFRSTVLGVGTEISPSGKAVIFSAGGSHSNNCIIIDSPVTDTFAAEVYGFDTQEGDGAGGNFLDNVFANRNSRSAQWGLGDQSFSISISNTSVTDDFTIDNIVANNGMEIDTIVDTRAVCDPPGTTNLLAPSDNDVDADLDIEFSWQAAIHATYYHFQLATDDAFSSLVHDSLSVDSTLFQAGPLEKNQDYFWRVRPRNNIAEADWSPTWTFKTIANPLPAVVTLLSPENGALGRFIPVQIDWMTATSTLDYWVQVADNSGFDSLLVDSTSVATTFIVLRDPVLQVSSTYYWRVRGQNAAGVSSEWSEVFSFSTIIPGLFPSNVSLSSPENNATRRDTMLTISWMAAANSSTYRLQLSDTDDFSGSVEETVAIADTSIFLADLEPNKDYWWRVKGQNDQGQSPLWSPVWKFTTGTKTTIDAHIEIPLDQEIEIYPNPAISILNISMGKVIAESIYLFDALGRSVKTIASLGPGMHLAKFKIDDLPVGVYYLVVENRDQNRSVFPVTIVR